MSEQAMRVEVGEGGFTGHCWCQRRPSWFSLTGLDKRCGGAGLLYCYCGGDLCVCHNHGEVECPGCADCEDDDDWGDGDA